MKDYITIHAKTLANTTLSLENKLLLSILKLLRWSDEEIETMNIYSKYNNLIFTIYRSSMDKELKKIQKLYYHGIIDASNRWAISFKARKLLKKYNIKIQH